MSLKMTMERHLEFLTEHMEPRYGLLNKVVSSKILPWRVVDAIKAAGPVESQNDQLLTEISRHGKEEQFLEVLTDGGHNQKHIVNYVNSNGNRVEMFGDCWPLSEIETETLTVNLDSLVDTLDCNDGLLGHLLSKNVINENQNQSIQESLRTASKNEELISILKRRSLDDYNQTISCLEDTGQWHIARVLKDRAVTAEVHITLKSDQADGNSKLKMAEESLVKIINDFLRPTDPTDQHYSATQEAVQQLEAVVEHLRKIGLSNSRLSESIILSFHCCSLDDLEKVNDELFNNENVKTMIMKVFADMGIHSAEGTDSLVCLWHKNSYDRCSKFFQDDDDRLSNEISEEVTPCEDDLSFTLSQTQLQRRVSRIVSSNLCYYPSQEHVASLLIKRLQFIFNYYQKGRRLEDFEDFDFRIYSAGSNMLLEQTRQRLRNRDAECLPSNVYGNFDALNYLSKMYVKTCRVTKETDKDLKDLSAEAIKMPKKLFIIIADEAHFVASGSSRSLEMINTWNHEKYPNVIVILVTATPGIFFRDSTSSRIPRISVAEKQISGEFVVVQYKDELRKKKIIEIETGKDISKEVGLVKELHVFKWGECYERRFEDGLVVTLRVPQRFSKNREDQIWLSVGDLGENELYSVVGKTNKNDATPLLLRGKNNIVRITNFDESKTLVVIYRPSRSQTSRYEVGFMPTRSVSDSKSTSCFFKVLMDAGEDVLELEVSQENGPLSRLKYTYAKSKLELGPATTDASKLNPSMTYQFLIDSYKNSNEVETGPQYLSLNFYYNSIRNLAPEEQLIRQDKNFEDMSFRFRSTPPDHLLAAEYAYYIVLLECMRKANPNENSVESFISNPMAFWKYFLEQRRNKLEKFKSVLEGAENSVKPWCFSDVIKFTEEKSWEELHRVCNMLQKQKDFKQIHIDEFYDALIKYLMHANLDSFTENMISVEKSIKPRMKALTKTAENFKAIFNTRKISVLCKNETFQIISDLIQTEDEAQEQNSMNGHMKIVRACSPKMANSIYATLTLARKVENNCFFEIIRYFHRFKLSDHKTNRRIWQILQPKHCTSLERNRWKKTLEPCRCENYVPKDIGIECKNCGHPHHSVNTFSDLDRLPCIIIVVKMGRMGDTFPPSLNVMDLRARRPKKPNLSSLIQEVGRICRYQVKSSYCPYVLVASKVMNVLEESLQKSVSFFQKTNLKPKIEPNWHHNRLLLVGEPQIGKTGVFLKIASQLRKIIKGDNDTFDNDNFRQSQLKRTRPSVETETQSQAKRRKGSSESQSLLYSGTSSPDSSEDKKLEKTAIGSMTIHRLPSEILDIILKKAIIFKTRNTEKSQLVQLLELCISQQNTKDKILPTIASCNLVWFEQMRAGKFQRSLQRYRKQTSLRGTRIIGEQIYSEKYKSVQYEVTLKQMKAVDAIHCPVCSNLFSDPVKLPCTHAFCLECIRMLVMNTSDNTSQCPLCFKEVLILDGSVESLPKATFLTRLVEISELPETTAKEDLCEECKEEQVTTDIPKAVIYCHVCDQVLCKDCQQRHQRQKTLKLHKLSPLGSQQRIMRNTAPQVTCMCDQHPTQLASLYCQTCHKAVCTLCKFDKNGAHLSHDCSLIGDVADECRRCLEECIRSVLCTMTKSTENHIQLSKELKWHQQAINGCREQLSIASTIGTRNLDVEKMEIEKYLAVVKQFSLYSQALHTSGSDIDIIQEFDALKEAADELQGARELLSTRPLPTFKDSLTNAELW